MMSGLREGAPESNSVLVANLKRPPDANRLVQRRPPIESQFVAVVERPPAANWQTAKQTVSNTIVANVKRPPAANCLVSRQPTVGSCDSDVAPIRNILSGVYLEEKATFQMRHRHKSKLTQFKTMPMDVIVFSRTSADSDCHRSTVSQTWNGQWPPIVRCRDGQRSAMNMLPTWNWS